MWSKLFPRVLQWNQQFAVTSLLSSLRSRGASLPVARSNTAGHRVRPQVFLIPVPVLAFGLAVAKCDSDSDSSNRKCGKRLPECAPKCTKSDLEKMKNPKPSCAQAAARPPNLCSKCASIDVDLTAQSNENAPAPEELTHCFMLKQAAGLTVDAVTRLLTQTVVALDDYHQQYREMMGMLLTLLEEGRAASPLNSELINCKMIVLRSQMEDVRKNLNEIEMFLSSVETLANQAAQTAYLARAEYPSIALSERLQSALIQVGTIKAQTKELENDLIQLQAVVIVESGKSLK